MSAADPERALDPAPPAGQPAEPRADPGAATAAEPLRPPPVLPPAGELIRGERSYRILGKLGSGGMGSVFLAERADGEFRQQVALKVMPWGGDPGEALLQRFKTERQILAYLDHPGIAKLLDGGRLPDGSPFLVMERIEGQRLDVWCRERGLSVEERLTLFRKVCLAVQAAHQALVVHRDLKPSNILVTAEGEPKLLDFGIAKLLDPALDWTVAETRRGDSLLTLRYASPEQVRGEPVTTATDVYALGVILYELLTGASPYRGGGGSVPGLIRAICEEEPTAPSTAASGRGGRRVPEPAAEPASCREAAPADLGRRLRGDLDAIVLKALRKDPRQRYASAEQLAEDVRRHLEGLPVAARQGTLAYRAGKFLRRHRWAALSAAALVLVLAVSAVLLALQLRRTRLERDKAERVTEFLVELFRVSDPDEAKGRTITAREVLDRGAERIGTELAGQPAVKAALQDAIGRVYHNLGLLVDARPLLESAVEIRRGLREEAPLEYAKSLGDLAGLLTDLAEYGEAERLQREALSLTERRLGEDHPDTLVHATTLAELLNLTERFPEAEAGYRRVLELRLRRLGYDRPPPSWEGREVGAEHWDLAKSLHNLGLIEQRLGRYESSCRSFEQALALKRKVLGERHLSVATSLEGLANSLGFLEQPERAYAMHLEAQGMLAEILGPEHPRVGASRVNLASELRLLGRPAEAIANLEQARAIFARSLGPEHPFVLTTLNNLANTYNDAGRSEEALALHREVLELRLRVLGEEASDVGQSYQNVGNVLSSLHRHSEAVEALARAQEVYERSLGAAHPFTQVAAMAAAASRIDAGDAASARLDIERLLPALERRADQPAVLLAARFNLARALVATGAGPADRQRAAELARLALEAAHEVGAQEYVSAAEIEAWLTEHALRPPAP